MRKLLVIVILWLCAITANSSQKSSGFHQAFVPARYAAVMKEHILTIEKNGWGKLGPEDLYHGHLVLKPRNESLREPVLFEKLFQESVGILYHSDEQMIRWKGEDGNLEIPDRRPRSFLGYWNGSVVKATSFFKNVTNLTADFACCGTIHMDELASERPKEFAFWRSYNVDVSDGKPCHVNLIVDIYYSSLHKGTIEVHGKPYVMTMDCKDSPW